MPNHKIITVTLLSVMFIFGSHNRAESHKLNPELFGIEEITEEKHESAEVEKRLQSRTYASYPEWYIVYSAQEYGEFVTHGGRPSQFPYFKAIKQFWGAKKMSDDQAIARNEIIDDETKTVIKTIGISFTLEYALIGLYETTIGRFTEYSNFLNKTPEDYYTDTIANEYGQSLNQVPWYEFPYITALSGLWSHAYGNDSLSIRGVERRVAFTFGYTIKALYAAVIRFASESSFSAAGLTTTLAVSGMNEDDLVKIPELEIIEHKENEIIVKVPRYRSFLTTASLITDYNGTVNSIENNVEIALSFVSQTPCMTETAVIIYKEPILSKTNTERTILLTDTTNLTSTIKNLRDCQITPEHIYDY